MNQRHVMAAMFLLGIAACTTSGPESPAPEVGTDGVKEQVGVSEATTATTIADDDELICTKERVTGSRIPTKVCLTRAERARIQEIAQASFEAAKRKPGATSSE